MNKLHKTRDVGLLVSRAILRSWACKMFEKKGVDFSKGWSDGFLNRWNLSVRVATKQASKKGTLEERKAVIEKWWEELNAT